MKITGLTIFSRVPQGSILGPLLFVIYMYINDIPSIPSFLHPFWFADDSKFLGRITSPLDQKLHVVQKDLRHLDSWSSTFRLDFNLTKHSSFIPSSKTNVSHLSQATSLMVSLYQRCRIFFLIFKISFNPTSFLLFNVPTFRLHHCSLHQSSTLCIQKHSNDMPNKYNLKFKGLLRGRQGHVVFDEMPFKNRLQQSATAMPWSLLTSDRWSAILICSASFINKVFSFLAWSITFMLLHIGWCCSSQVCSAMVDLFVSPHLVAI